MLSGGSSESMSLTLAASTVTVHVSLPTEVDSGIECIGEVVECRTCERMAARARTGDGESPIRGADCLAEGDPDVGIQGDTSGYIGRCCG